MAARSRWLATIALLFGLNAAELSADDPKPAMRPISDAGSVLAVYRDGSGLAWSDEPAIILAAWPDGYIVWSSDRLKGGPPYRAGHIDPKRVAALLARFDRDGLFADERLAGNFAPDSQFTTVFIKSGKRQVKMCSSHEACEELGGTVFDHLGACTRVGRHKLDVLRKAPPDYLVFRLVWSEVRRALADLIPGESKAIEGKSAFKASELFWQEPAVTSPRRR